MVYINNIEIEKYNLDDFNSIINRIASIIQTLPELLYFPENTPTSDDFMSDKNIIVEDLKEDIINAESFDKLYKNIEKKEKGRVKYKLNISDILKYYILLNKNFNYEYDIITLQDFDTEKFLNEKFKLLKEIEDGKNITLFYINNIISGRETLKEKFDKDIEKLINNWNDNSVNLKLFKEFEDIKGVNYSKFELEKIEYTIELKLYNVTSILEIFNLIILNDNIPFATCNNFYKVLKDFIPPIKWKNLFDKSKSYKDKFKNIDREKNIILKILNEKKIKNINSYTEIIINIKEIENKNCIINITLKYNKYNISKEKIKKNILSIFEKSKIINEKDNSVNGLFYIPLQTLNKEVMFDLIMNDPLFSSLLVINESNLGLSQKEYENEKISKTIYFENTIIGKVTFKISSNKVENKNDILNKQNKNLYPINSSYLRIKISKANDINKVELFQKLLSKLITLYNQKCNKIVAKYLEYYMNIGDCKNEFKYNEIKDKNDLFPEGYKSACQKSVRPTIISEEEAMIAIEEGKNVLKFPKEETYGISPKYFICNIPKNPKFIYPGLFVNKLENDEDKKFQYLPCCYQAVQTNTPEYLNYYEDKDIDIETEKNKKKGGQDIYKTRKIMELGSHGILPTNISKLFFLSDENAVYYRQGVLRDKNSFISCILNATKNSKLNPEKLRKEFIKPEFISCCKQEMYDYTEEEIIELIKNADEYFDPKLFIHILELYFECNIFLFTYENNGKLILPRHTKGYFKNENNNRCIFIFEHMGSQADKAEYPQCEIIVKQPDINKKDTIDIFNYDDKESQYVIKYFNKINTSYILNKYITFNNLNLPWNKLILKSQVIDSYGKTRIINILYEDKYVSILTQPIQPLKLVISDKIYKTNTITAINLLKNLEYNKKSIREIKDNGTLKEIKFIIGNIDAKILIDDNLIIDKELSILNEYNKFKKLSRYMVEYLYWLFSNYLLKNDIKEINDEIFVNFKDEYIEINPDYIYDNDIIPKTFSMNNSSIMLNNKLIVKSEDVLKRLFYILRLSIIRNYDNIISYYKKNMIDNYYIDIIDFSYYNNQVIIEGEKSFIRLISEDNKNIIYDNINIKKEFIEDKNKDEDSEYEYSEDEDDIINTYETIKYKKKSKLLEINFKKSWDINPYFFKNKLINNKIYLAQNTDSFLKCIEIAKIWNDKKYNPGNNVFESNLKKFTLYSIINKNDIKKYFINEGEDNDLNIKIIGYKILNPSTLKFNNLYTILLDI